MHPHHLVPRENHGHHNKNSPQLIVSLDRLDRLKLPRYPLVVSQYASYSCGPSDP